MVRNTFTLIFYFARYLRKIMIAKINGSLWTRYTLHNSNPTSNQYLIFYNNNILNEVINHIYVFPKHVASAIINRLTAKNGVFPTLQCYRKTAAGRVKYSIYRRVDVCLWRQGHFERHLWMCVINKYLNS